MSTDTDSPDKAAPAIGPALARALEAITALSRGLALTASVHPAEAHQLSLRLQDKAGDTVTLFIEPVRDQANYYQKSHRLGLWYLREDGSPATAPPWIEPALEGVARVVFSPAHDGVAGELIARVGVAKERAPRPPAGRPIANMPPVDETKTIARRAYFGLVPASPRHALRKMLKPFYDRYVLEILSRYLPAEARSADFVLDAMCGRNLPNLAPLRRYFAGALIVAATDIDIDEGRKAPRGTSVFRSDLMESLPGAERYQLITVFKPPTGGLGRTIDTVFANLAAALVPGGHLFIVFGANDGVDEIEDALRRLGLSIITSQANMLRSTLEIEHTWILVGRAPR